MLFSCQLKVKEEIKKDFSALEIVVLKEEVIELNEGIYHKGKASVIRFIGKRSLKE